MKIVSTIKNTISNNKTNIKISSAFIICVLSILISGISYSNKVDETLKENIRVAEDYNDLLQDYNSLVDDHNSLYKQYDDLNNLNNELQEQIQNYQDQQNTIDELTSKLSETQKEYDSLKDENDELLSEIDNSKSQSYGGNGGRRIGSYDDDDDDYESGGVVWISETGSKYHDKPNCGRMNPNKAREVSKSSAESMGLSACSKCF